MSALLLQRIDAIDSLPIKAKEKQKRIEAIMREYQIAHKKVVVQSAECLQSVNHLYDSKIRDERVLFKGFKPSDIRKVHLVSKEYVKK